MHQVFHPGEVALQERVGAAAQLAQIGPRVIRDRMPQQHRDFFAQLPFLIAGSVDAQGQPWASALAGPAGFVQSPHDQLLQVRAVPLPGDPLYGALQVGAPIGLLGIEPHTRRRNRMNGTVAAADATGFDVRVDQSFGNCPKYIQARRAIHAPRASAGPGVQHLDGLDDAARAAIAAADTFFIASAHAQSGVDVSHRGGKPGFVRVQGNTLTVPDFAGNAFFNTLGNLALEPRCGLLFIDDVTGTVLMLAATAQIVFDGTELASFAGAQRLLRLEVGGVLRMESALPLRWEGFALSPHLQGTGAWG